MIRELLASAVRAAELTPPKDRKPSPRVTAGLLLEELGDVEAEKHAEEVLRLIKAARELPGLRLVK